MKVGEIKEKFKNTKDINEELSQKILALRNLLIKRKIHNLFSSTNHRYFLSDLKFLKAFKKQSKKTLFSFFFCKKFYGKI